MQIKITKTGSGWEASRRALDHKLRRAATSVAVREQLRFFQGKVGEAFTTAGASNGKPWPATSTGKQAFDGSTVARAIRVNHPPGALRGYVYIPAGFRFRGGKQPAIRALIAHEFGTTYSVRVTAKLLRALQAKRRAEGSTRSTGQRLQVGGAMVVTIPRRSFLVDTLAAHGGDLARRRFIDSLVHELGKLGWTVR